MALDSSDRMYVLSQSSQPELAVLISSGIYVPAFSVGASSFINFDFDGGGPGTAVVTAMTVNSQGHIIVVGNYQESFEGPKSAMWLIH